MAVAWTEPELEEQRLWNEAQSAAIQRGWRLDSPEHKGKSWVVVATTATAPGEKPEHITGRGDEAGAALRAFLAHVAEPVAKAAASHCPTCTCTPEA